MLRSLIAAIIAVLLGVSGAQLVERIGLQLFSGANASAGTMSAVHQLVLIASWGAGAFIAASLALLIGRRWAPLGWLCAASILLLAIMSAVSAPQALTLIAGATLATLGAGFGAVKLLRASYAFPVKAEKPGLF